MTPMRGRPSPRTEGKGLEVLLPAGKKEFSVMHLEGKKEESNVLRTRQWARHLPL